MVESINYKKIFTQKVQHQEFIHKLDEFMEHHNDEIEDQDEQIMGILKYLTEWLVNHILYVDGQIPKGWYSKKTFFAYFRDIVCYHIAPSILIISGNHFREMMLSWERRKIGLRHRFAYEFEVLEIYVNL